MILVYTLIAVLLVICIYLLYMFRQIIHEIAIIKADIERNKESILRVVKNYETLLDVINRLRDEFEDLQSERRLLDVRILE